MFGPQFFAHSGRGSVLTGEGFGCNCEICAREISAPHRFQGAVVWCLYCGMERGLVPLIEVPGGLEYLNGITREECKMVLANVERLDEWATQRSYDLGHVVFELCCDHE